MQCLLDYVGLKICGEGQTSPPSALWINSLNGIGLDQLSSLADTDQRSVEGVWSDIQTRAMLRFSDDVRDAFNKKYRITNIMQSMTTLKTVDSDTTSTADANTWKGFTVDMRPSLNDSAITKNSTMSAIHIQRLALKVPSANNNDNVEFAVFDLLTGEKLFTKTVHLKTGWNTVEVNKTFTAEHFDIPQVLFVAFDADVVECYDKTLDSILTSHYAGGMQIKGATATYTTTSDAIQESDLTKGNNTYGLSGEVSIKCGWDGVVCSNKEVFKRAWWLCLGVECMNEQLSSTRLSKYTSIGQTKAKENADQWYKEYHESLTQAVDGIDIDQADMCIECNETYRTQLNIP